MHIGMVSKLDSFLSHSLEERLEAWTVSGTGPRHSNHHYASDTYL